MQNRGLYVAVILAVTTSLMWAQQPPPKSQPAPAKPAKAAPAAEEKHSFAEAPPALAKLLEAKVTAEWEAIKNRDKEAYNRLLTDDFIAVEDDSEGARSRYKAADEIPTSNVRSYTLERLKAFSLGPNAAFVKYESTMGFQPKAAVRFKRIWISEIWVRQGGEWKMWRYQDTKVK